MFSSDLIVTFFFIVLLFIRQIFVIKQPRKINYAPLVLGIGILGSLTHFIITPERVHFILLIKESLFPLFVALLLYLIINVIQQTQKAQEEQKIGEMLNNNIYEILNLKDFVYTLEKRIILLMQENKREQEIIKEHFKNGLKTFEIMKKNQELMLERFDIVEIWQKNVNDLLDDFTHTKVPEFDDVIHKHIDILRVAEQDHFNKLKLEIEKYAPTQIDVENDIKELKQNMVEIKNLGDVIAKSITKHILHQLSDIIKEFESQVSHLKSHTEAVTTSLAEGENFLHNIKLQSEMIMKQMRLSSDKMEVLQSQNDKLYNSYDVVKDLIHDIETVRKEYLQSKITLSDMIDTFYHTEKEEIQQIKSEIMTLMELLSQKIEASIKQLQEHYHITDTTLPQSVQILSQKNKVLQEYTQFNQAKSPKEE